MVEKSNQMEYYAKELLDMANHVKKCDTAILDDMKYFRDEADAHMQPLDVLKEKGNRKVDFLFLDGSHTSSEVRLDVENYGGFVADNRIMGFHNVIKFKDR